MAPPRLSAETKKLRGTFERAREPAHNPGRVRLSEPVPPPDGLDKDAKSEWRLHMALCLQAGTLASTDLATFRALAETAVLLARAYRAALKTGPVSYGDRGSKMAPEWQAWGVVNTKYLALAAHFGLTPASARTLPQLPPAKGAVLRQVS